jgi:hypothetical protein
MSYEYDDGNIMNAFFKGKIKMQDLGPKYERVEVGHGVGIGHRDGSYSQYIKQLSERSKEGNGLIYLGKAINEDKNTMSIVNETKKFDTGDVPKLLIMFHNILNELRLKVEWKDMDNDVILEQYYQVPLPYSMEYNWWDTYSTYFIGPEDLEEGDYIVEITSKEIAMGRQSEELSSIIEFSVKGKD